MRPALGWRDRQLLGDATRVVGIDEVGRGALAGPVVVGGVAFTRVPRQAQVQDSKTLTRRQRERAADWIRVHCDRFAVVEVWVELVDRVNILAATRSAMRALALTLAPPGSVVVSDGVGLDLGEIRSLSPCRADASYFAVAAASIVAKVHRDDLMAELAVTYPQWGWERNVGYPSSAHRRAIATAGLTFLHRRSFRCSPA